MRVSLTNQRAQLRGQGWLSPQLPKRYPHPHRSETLLAATSKPDTSIEAVRAEFLKAGIPDEAVTKALKQYPPYLLWPIETKMRPALTAAWQPAAVTPP